MQCQATKRRCRHCGGSGLRPGRATVWVDKNGKEWPATRALRCYECDYWVEPIGEK